MDRPHSHEQLKYIGPLAISLVFCVMGLWMLFWSWRAGLVTLTFFGLCLGVLLETLLRRRREQRLMSLGIQSVRVLGGVDIPMARGRFLVLGLALLAIGAASYVAGAAYPRSFLILGLLIGATGLALLAALPLMGRGRLRFDPDGMLIGDWRFEVRIAWDNIGWIGLRDDPNNALVTLRLHDIEHIAVQPPSRHAAFLKRLAWTRRWHDADIIIPAQHFGLPAPLLAAAIARCARDPDARRELADRLLEHRT